MNLIRISFEQYFAGKEAFFELIRTTFIQQIMRFVSNLTKSS